MFGLLNAVMTVPMRLSQHVTGLIAIAVLAITAQRARVPQALMKPYRRGAR